MLSPYIKASTPRCSNNSIEMETTIPSSATSVQTHQVQLYHIDINAKTLSVPLWFIHEIIQRQSGNKPLMTSKHYLLFICNLESYAYGSMIIMILSRRVQLLYWCCYRDVAQREISKFYLSMSITSFYCTFFSIALVNFTLYNLPLQI